MRAIFRIDMFKSALLCVCLLMCRTADAQDTATPPNPAPDTVPAPAAPQAGSPTPPPLNRVGYQVFGTLRLREEDYNWFPAAKGNGAYTFFDGFARVGVSRATRTEDFVLEFQVPFLAGLPTHAIAPAPEGSLGQGANYQDANHNQAASFFLKQGYVRFKNAGGANNSVRLGRFEFRDGQETTSADDTLTWLKLNRIGHGNLAMLYDLSIDYQASHALTLALYFAYADGGDVISSVYRGHEATFAYAETTYHF